MGGSQSDARAIENDQLGVALGDSNSACLGLGDVLGRSPAAESRADSGSPPRL